MAACLFGQAAEEKYDLVGRAGEFRPEVLLLGGDPDRAGVEVALANHLAAHGEERKRPEAEPLRPEQGGDNDVAPGAQPSVGLQEHSRAKTVGSEHLVRLGQPQLPWRAGVLDRDERRGAGASLGSGDGDDIGLRLGDSDRDRAHARLGHQLHRDEGRGLERLQVVDELGEVLDRVDVVMRGRRDEGHPGLGISQTGDLGRHLVPGELAPFTRLRALGHLDLELVGGMQVGRSDTESARCNLLDRRVDRGAEPLRGPPLPHLSSSARRSGSSPRPARRGPRPKGRHATSQLS